MSVLSIVMLIASIFFLYLVIRNINKNNILFEQAFMWIVISLVMIVISVFDSIRTGLHVDCHQPGYDCYCHF